MNAIAIRGLVKRYGAHTIFDGLDLNVAHGERLAVLGASGCGKSTLLRCIAGLESWDGGEIDVSGGIGYVFQEPRLFGWLDVERNVAFAARNSEEKARVGEVLALVGMTSARAKLPKHLSGGMAQRAALARALVRKPEILLFDEPLAALDALTRLELRASLRDILTQAGATAVWVTHDVDDALSLATRTIVLQRAPNFVRAVEPAVGVDVGVRRALLASCTGGSRVTRERACRPDVKQRLEAQPRTDYRAKSSSPPAIITATMKALISNSRRFSAHRSTTRRSRRFSAHRSMTRRPRRF